jgi:N-acyl-D-amino-acid deacylase
VRGGTIIDGSGAPRFDSDVGILNDHIVEIGQLDANSLEIIDATGKIVAPGFIDVHTHDDCACLAHPEMLPKISQGVTTVIVGNCGLSAAPIRFDNDVPEPFNLLGKASDFRYAKFAEYAAAVDAAKPRTNVAALAGHSTLRAACMSDLSRRPSTQELEQMRAKLDEAMKAGALGMSSGVFYAPATTADRNELVAIAEVVAAAGGVYATHIRDEYDGVIASLEEAFDTAATASLPVIISHHKCAGVKNWGRSVETLALVNRVAKHQSVHMDCYPYTAGSTVIDPDLADGTIEIQINSSQPYPEFAGRYLKEISELWGVTQREAAQRLVPGSACYFQMHEDDVRRIIAHPLCMIGSDGLPNDPQPHPRLWGTFPRVLGVYAREHRLFTLEEAVRKMTGLSAQRFGLVNRGRIARDFIADITVFDAATIADTSTFSQPAQLSAGIDHVLVNGSVAWSHGQPAAPRAGRFLRRGQA